MKQWRASIWTATFGLNDPGAYKLETVLRSYLPTYTKGNQWKLINSWPSVIRYGELTYTQSEAKIIELMITYDWADEIVETASAN